MNDPTILFCKPKAISAADKKMLRDAGVIVVSVDDPSAVKLTKAGAELSGSQMLSAAMAAMNNCQYGNSVKQEFGAAIMNAILGKPQV